MNKILAAVEGKPAMERIQNPASNVLTFPGLEMQAIYHNGILVPLTHHEFFTLLYFAQHPLWVLSQSMIYEAVWKENLEHCGAAVTNVISQIRRKIGESYIDCGWERV